MDEHLAFIRLAEEPERRRCWLLYRALESLPLDRAVELDTLAREGLVTVLAERNLTAMNGQPASFLAGGEFPVPVAGAAATAGATRTITVEFKKFGVSLDVTPTIIDAERLNLRIRS